MTYSPGALPDQTSRTFVITGGNAGLGYFTAEQLASTGAHVVLAARNSERADAAVRSLRALVPGASVDTIPLDLTSLASVRAAGARLADYGRIDGLVLNAGITSGSRRRELTGDGFETTFQSNYLGHFALTALAWPALARTAGSRVVGLGSIATSLVRLAPDDLQTAGRYDFFRAYGLSKHAIHGFILELDRRARLAGTPVSAVLAHPGFALDGNSAPRPGINDRASAAQRFAERLLRPVAHGKDRGAWPVVRAAVDPDARGGDFYGPARSVTGPPVLTSPVPQSADPAFGSAFWDLAERATGVKFEV